MKKFKSTGVSLPEDLLQSIDNERGDVPRSRYLLKLIRKGYGGNDHGDK